MATPPLPPGFQLEQSGGVPPLPPGFQLETNTPEPAPGMGEQLARQLGLTGRYALEGVGNTLGIVSDPIGQFLPGYQKTGEAAASLADTLGLPKPKGDLEETVAGASKALAGTGLTAGAGQAAGAAELASQPILQALSSIAGGGAQSAAQQAGASPEMQALAGLGASLGAGAPMALTNGARALIRGGGKEAQQRMLDNMAAFEAAGTTPSVGQATQNPLARGLESILAKVPGGSGVMTRKAEQQAKDIGTQMGRYADDLAPGSDPTQAGLSIEKGIAGEGGFVDRFKQQAKTLYDAVDQHMPGDTAVPLPATQSLLARLTSPIQGAEATSGVLANPKVQQIAKAVGLDTERSEIRNMKSLPSSDSLAIPPAPTREDMARASSVMEVPISKLRSTQSKMQWDRFNSGDHPPAMIEGYSALPIAVRKENGEFLIFDGHHRAVKAANSGATMMPMHVINAKDYAPEFAGRAPMKGGMSDDEIIAALGGDVTPSPASPQRGTMPYQAIKQLRTKVGDMIADAGLVSDVPRGQLKQLYGALSDDMRNATAKNPEAFAANNRAENFYRSGMDQIDKVESIVGKAGGPEAVFKAAMSGTREGASTLNSVMSALKPDEQNVVSSAVVRRLGLANPGVQNETGDAFSTASFLTNWNKLSPQAKSVLFKGNSAMRDNLDQIAKVTSNLREGSKVFTNPSGTASTGAQIGTAASAALAALSGNVGGLGAIGAGVGAANLSARLMTNPNFVKWLARNSTAPMGVLPAQIGYLGQLGEKNGDQDLMQAAQLIGQTTGASTP